MRAANKNVQPYRSVTLTLSALETTDRGLWNIYTERKISGEDSGRFDSFRGLIGLSCFQRFPPDLLTLGHAVTLFSHKHLAYALAIHAHIKKRMFCIFAQSLSPAHLAFALSIL